MKPYLMSGEEFKLLRHQFSRLEEITPFSEDPKFSALVASLGILREIGTVNDEIARFIFDRSKGVEVSRNSLKAELVQWNGFVGVRIWSVTCNRLEIRAKWIHDLIHPDLSYDQVDGGIKQLVVFPEIAARLALLEGVEIVLVKSWGMNSIFGGFDPSKGYYQTNFWELENNDALKFADLVRQKRLALLGTHDLIAHLAGIKSESWNALSLQGQKVYDGISSYFQSVKKPSIAALILPYTIGVILDDLAQPPTYNSSSHLVMLDALLLELEKRSVPASVPTFLKQFPQEFERIIHLSRSPTLVNNPYRIAESVQRLVQQILDQSLTGATPLAN